MKIRSCMIANKKTFPVADLELFIKVGGTACLT